MQNNFIYPADELTYLDFAGLVHSTQIVYFLVLDHLWWEEVIYFILHNQLVVIISLNYKPPCLLLENS